MLNKNDKRWIKNLPNTAFFGWAGFKHELMEYLGMDERTFATWNVPPEWLKAFKYEVRRRNI